MVDVHFSVNFAHVLDPNVPQGGYPSGGAPSLLSGLNWQQWAPFRPELLMFEDPDVLTFSFREEAVAYLNCLTRWPYDQPYLAFVCILPRRL
ncbi:hypothetical protein SCLCIDRAFT_1225184, partial [Scleroderma citrinum Foug A]